jgi:hypothetical protein
MIKSRTVTNDRPTDNTDHPPDAAPAAGRPRPRRTLRLDDRLARVPIGFLWMGVLAIVAVPVFIYMTCLYWAVRWTSALFRGKRREERVA